MRAHHAGVAALVTIALVALVIVSATMTARATVVYTEPDRVVEVTIPKNDREVFLRELTIFADRFSFHSDFSASRSNPDEPFPLLWRNDFIIYVQPTPSDDANRLVYHVSIYSRGLEPMSKTTLDQLIQGLGSAAGKIEDATFTITK